MPNHARIVAAGTLFAMRQTRILKKAEDAEAFDREAAAILVKMQFSGNNP